MRPSSAALLLARASAPPLLQDVVGLFADADLLLAFYALVHRLTPEAEEDVRHARGAIARALAFTSAFSRRWWPIEVDEDTLLERQEEGESIYGAILEGVPCYFMGIEYEEWEHVPSSGRTGFILMCALCASQFDDPDGPFADSRVALLEAAAGIVGDVMARRIPKDGYSLADLRNCCASTPYEALTTLSAMLNGEADNDWLDISQQEFYESYGGVMDWDQETIEVMAAAYTTANSAMDSILQLEKWLAEDPKARFGLVLRALRKTPAQKEQLPLPLIEVFKEELEDKEEADDSALGAP